MADNPETTASDLLCLLLPSERMIRFLQATFDNRQKRGETIPDRDRKWLARCRKLKDNLPADMEGITDQQLQDLERMIFGNEQVEDDEGRSAV